MKHPCLIFLYVVAFLYLSLSACTAPRQTASLSDENTKQLYNYYYTEGERQRVLGNNEAAFALLSEASRIDTSAPAGQFALANYYMQLNRPDTAIYMLHKAAEGDTTQYWYNFFYARITSLAGLNDEATRIWRRLIRQHPRQAGTELGSCQLLACTRRRKSCIGLLRLFREFHRSFRASYYQENGIIRTDGRYCCHDSRGRETTTNLSLQHIIHAVVGRRICQPPPR